MYVCMYVCIDGMFVCQQFTTKKPTNAHLMRVMHVNVHPHSHSQIQFTFCHDFSSHSVTTFMYMMLCATYIHTHIHTYIHAYTHTYIHTCAVCAISASSVGGTLQRPGRVGLVKTLSRYPALRTSNWSKLDWSKLDLTKLDWSKLDWSKLDWSKLDWSKLDWSKLDWSNSTGQKLIGVPNFHCLLRLVKLNMA